MNQLSPYASPEYDQRFHVLLGCYFFFFSTRYWAPNPDHWVYSALLIFFCCAAVMYRASVLKLRGMNNSALFGYVTSTVLLVLYVAVRLHELWFP